MARALLMGMLLVLYADRAWPCSVVGPLPKPSALVAQAEVIVIVRVEGLSGRPGQQGTMAAARGQVRFTVLKVLKGTLPPGELVFNGELTAEDDPNDRPVPYDFVRPGGRAGNCFALGYRRDADYLLLLRRGDHPAYAQSKELTPCWSPLAPTNEQLFGGGEDPWLVWVVRQLSSLPGA
jgi:hypothetical protein